MKASTYLDSRCPDNRQLELLILDVELSEETRKRLQMHIQQCEVCQKRSREIDTFYSLLLQEISMPVTDRVLEFSKSLSDRSTEYAMVRCDPIEPQTRDGEQHFQAALVYRRNGKPDSSGEKMIYRDLEPSQFGMRLITDPDCKLLLIYLYSNGRQDYNRWVLSIPGIAPEIHFNRGGYAAIPLVSLDRFNGAELYCHHKPIQSSKETRFERILERALG